MYKVITIKNRKIIFLPATLLIFQYQEGLVELFQNAINGIGKDESDCKNYKYVEQIIHNEQECRKQLEQRREQYKSDYNIRLTGAQINVAYECNLQCGYCFAGDGGHNKKGKMKIQTAQKITEYFLCNAEKNKKKSIQIVGGEPLLNMNAFEEIVRYASVYSDEKDNIEFLTTTNGTCFNKEIVKFFNQQKISFMVSLDSHEKDVNDRLRVSKANELSTYDSIMNNFMKYKNNASFDAIHVTITPYNKNIDQIAEKFYDMGIYHLHFDMVKSNNEIYKFTKKDIDDLEGEYSHLADRLINYIIEGKKVSCHPLLTKIGKLNKRKPINIKCGTLYNMLAFDPFGYIYPCDMLMWDDYCVGSTKVGLDYNKISDIKKLYKDDSMCNACWARYMCGGLCLATQIYYKNEEQRLLMCRLNRHIFKLKIYIYITLREKNCDFDFEKYS